MLRVAIVWTFITIFLVFSYGNIDEDRLEIPSSIFIIAGVQKAGTTALAAYLAQHPNISFADNKELHFFDKNKNYKKGISTYLKHFHVIPSSILIGEATPAYLPSRAACRRIAEHFPQAKLIVLLRNPLSRAYSEYQMKARRVALQEDFIAKVRYSVDEVYSCIKQHAEDYDAIKACLPVEIATHGRIGKLNKALRQAFEELDDWNQVLQLCFSRYNASSTDYSIDINGRSQLGVDGLAFQPKRCWTYYKDGFERLPELHRAFVEEIESFKNCSGFIVNSTLSGMSPLSIINTTSCVSEWCMYSHCSAV